MRFTCPNWNHLIETPISHKNNAPFGNKRDTGLTIENSRKRVKYWFQLVTSGINCTLEQGNLFVYCVYFSNALIFPFCHHVLPCAFPPTYTAVNSRNTESLYKGANSNNSKQFQSVYSFEDKMRLEILWSRGIVNALLNLNGLGMLNPMRIRWLFQWMFSESWKVTYVPSYL